MPTEQEIAAMVAAAMGQAGAVAPVNNGAASALASCMTGSISLIGTLLGLGLGTTAKVIGGVSRIATKLEAPVSSIVDSSIRTVEAGIDAVSPLVGMAASTLELVAVSAASASMQAQSQMDSQLEALKAEMVEAIRRQAESQAHLAAVRARIAKK
jgi:hypothetical protein